MDRMEEIKSMKSEKTSHYNKKYILGLLILIIFVMS